MLASISNWSCGSIPPTDFLASNWEWWETMIMTIATFTLARREAPPFQQGSMWDKWALKRRAVAKRDICSWRPANILGHGTSTGRVHCGRFFFHEIGWKAWCCTRMNAAVSVPAADRCFLEIHFNFSVLVTWRGKKFFHEPKESPFGCFSSCQVLVHSVGHHEGLQNRWTRLYRRTPSLVRHPRGNV